MVQQEATVNPAELISTHADGFSAEVKQAGCSASREQGWRRRALAAWEAGCFPDLRPHLCTPISLHRLSLGFAGAGFEPEQSNLCFPHLSLSLHLADARYSTGLYKYYQAVFHTRVCHPLLATFPPELGMKQQLPPTIKIKSLYAQHCDSLALAPNAVHLPKGSVA